jgi:hypothetical protein
MEQQLYGSKGEAPGLMYELTFFKAILRLQL